MLTNLLWPWVLARMVVGLSTAVLCSYAWRQSRGLVRTTGVRASEAQLVVERRAELAGAVVRAALAFGALSLALTVLAADGLSEAVRGAMCAWGVFESGDGFLALWSSALLTLGAGVWLALHRYDYALERPTLTRLKFRALTPLCVLAWVDLALNARFFHGLDLGVAASCCSTGLDAVRTRWMPGSEALARGSVALGGLVLGALAVALHARNARTPRRGGSFASAGVSLLAALIALPAVLWYVAPHAYEAPHHNCPFCLLHADVLGLGFWLFGGLMWAAVDSIAVAVVELVRPAGSEGVTARVLRGLSRRAAIAWSVALVAALTPVVRYAVVTGGGSLF